jgi:hypothetical protein
MKIEVRNLRDFAQLDEIPFLLEYNTPAQHCKDIVAAFVVFYFGGQFADCKILWRDFRRICLPSDVAVALGTEPAKKYAMTTARAMVFPHIPLKEPEVHHAEGFFDMRTTESDQRIGKTEALGQVWLGFYKAKPRAAFLKRVFEKMFDHWQRRARRVQQGTLARTDWGNINDAWMENTDIFYREAKAFRDVRFLAPITVCPVPAFMTRLAVGTSCFRYYVPSPQDLDGCGGNVALTLWTDRFASLKVWTRGFRVALSALLYKSNAGIFTELIASQSRTTFLERIEFYFEGRYRLQMLAMYAPGAVHQALASAYSLLQASGPHSTWMRSWLDSRRATDDQEANLYAFCVILFAHQWVNRDYVHWTPDILGPNWLGNLTSNERPRTVFGRLVRSFCCPGALPGAA